MIKILLFIRFFGIVNEHEHAQNGYDDTVRHMLINWNKATLNSLNNQYQSASDSTKKAMYAEKLTEFKRTNECNSAQVVDTVSARYKFLAFFLSKIKNKEVFIVEANRMGAKATIRNYVVWKKKDGSAQVDYYFFSNENEWLKQDFTMTLTQANISLPLSNYFVKPSEGFNSDDVIISYFAANDAHHVTSEFFTLGTLNRKCSVIDM